MKSDRRDHVPARRSRWRCSRSRGCAGLHDPGAAATVGDEPIPSSEVDDVTADQLRRSGGSAPAAPARRSCATSSTRSVTTRVDTQYAESVRRDVRQEPARSSGVQQLEDSLTEALRQRPRHLRAGGQRLRCARQLMLTDVGAKSSEAEGHREARCRRVASTRAASSRAAWAEEEHRRRDRPALQPRHVRQGRWRRRLALAAGLALREGRIRRREAGLRLRAPGRAALRLTS